jgi:4'-phosphopantetheinyl transferase
MQKIASDSHWSYPPDDLEFRPHFVDIWRVSVNVLADSRNRLASILAAEEVARAARFHFAVDRDRFIAAHGCLRDILTRYLHCEPGQLNFSTGKYGKPALISNEGLDFNLSHSGDYALIAITERRNVGVDVELMRERISPQAIARRFFSQAEVAELQALPLEQQEAAFFRCWTRKEAYIKAQGLGLALSLESFDVSLSPHDPAVLRATRPDFKEASRWTLLHLDIAPCYQAAAAVENIAAEPALHVRLWDWTAKK